MKPIKKISIIGVGFMGGSLALDLHEVFPCTRLTGYARSQSAFDRLSKLSILDNVEQDLAKALKNSDIVALAMPVFAIIDFFKKIAPFLKDGAIVFDLGSSKELVEKAAAKFLPKNVYFVGCHPLAGSEKGGAQFAKAGLYRDTVCIITAPCSLPAAKTIKELWESVGAKVIFMPSSKHDKILSIVSHLNHIISFAATLNIPDNYLKFSPPSLKDLTRISNSPARVWADIFISNKANILKDVDKFIGVLETFKKLISGNKKNALTRLIEKINKKQSVLISQR